MLQELKDDLKITWNEEDHKLERLLKSGIEYLENDIAGKKLDFETSESNKTLLFSYCRYAYYNTLEHFEENFQSKLTTLQIKSAVSMFEQSQI